MPVAAIQQRIVRAKRTLTEARVPFDVPRGAELTARLIQRGFAALARAERLGQALGPYALQASIAACHARARRASQTDWDRIAALYDALAQLKPSPVVELNRAVSYSMAIGPAAGLEIVDGLVNESTLKNHHLLPTVRGDLLFKLGRHAEARTEFLRAASLTRNVRERDLMTARAAACLALEMEY